ncbi:MAG: hypothetical protein KF819_03570 [Labilithrix sp.]|nr:hypothetical protein [Labilithrix sp.]
MNLLTCFGAFGIATSLALVIGCGGQREEPPCPGPQPVTQAAAARLRLSRVDFGGRDAAGHARTVGRDLDGVCTTGPDRLACRAPEGAPASLQFDAEGGVDNAFGKHLLPAFDLLYGRSNEKWSGASVLDVDESGDGTLFLLEPKGTMVRIPLTHARIAETDEGQTLTAVIPTGRLVELFREDARAIDADLCPAAALVTIESFFRQVSDMRADGDATLPCDALSLGLVFEGSPVDTLPEPRPSLCREKD